MNRTLLGVGIIVIALLVIVGGAFYVLQMLNHQPSTNTNNPVNFPISSSTPSQTNTGSQPGGNSTMTVGTQNGGTITIQDFIHNGVTAEDTVNPGTYYLAGSVGYCNADGTCPSGADTKDFHIVYFSQDKAFIISLTKEPLSTSRTEAEQFLMNALGLSRQNMCNLNYQVLTTVSTNSIYSGQNLGFSFCPGAIKLP